MPFMCTQCRTKFTLKYLCFADVVNSDLHVAGTADLQNNGSSFQTLTEYSQTLPQLAGQTVVMPGQSPKNISSWSQGKLDGKKLNSFGHTWPVLLSEAQHCGKSRGGTDFDKPEKCNVYTNECNKQDS